MEHQTAPRVRVGLLLLLTVLAVGVLAGTASASPAGEQRLVAKINGVRRAAGLGPLQVDVELQRVARAWTDVMTREDRLYHNPNLADQVQRDWQRLGENVGWTQSSGATEAALVDRVHTAFMGSPGHRANVLRPEFNWVGVGVRVTAAGKLWTTVNFMQGAGQGPPPPPLGPGEFRDVNGGTHAPAIKAIALRGVTQGCAHELFCPDRVVTRAQMASFLARARNLPPAAGTQFSDIASSPHRDAINALAAAGITGGCGEGRFCPNAPVSRSQMASFLQRAWSLSTTSASFTLFSDVASTSVHLDAINAIANAGITQGCAVDRYCPNQGVRRAEMASFLGRALGLV